MYRAATALGTSSRSIVVAGVMAEFGNSHSGPRDQPLATPRPDENKARRRPAMIPASVHQSSPAGIFELERLNHFKSRVLNEPARGRGRFCLSARNRRVRQGSGMDGEPVEQSVVVLAGTSPAFIRDLHDKRQRRVIEREG